MNRVASFRFVSYEQFKKDFLEALPELDPDSAYRITRLPRRATKGSAGYDFFSPIDFTLAPGETINFPSGIRARIDDGWVLLIYPRSGLGFKYRLQLDNSVGIVDSDYYNSDNEGHIFFKITNDSKENKEIHIERGAAFAQGIFVPFGITLDDVVTAERNGGLGSTDRA